MYESVNFFFFLFRVFFWFESLIKIPYKVYFDFCMFTLFLKGVRRISKNIEGIKARQICKKLE